MPGMDNNFENESLRYQSKKEMAKGGLLGFFIGLAIIVPGISGSAVAIIFRLYEKLLFALGHILRKFKVCALFLLPIAIGAVIGLVLGFLGVQQLLDLIPFAIVSCFAGLMVGAYPAVTDQLKGEKPNAIRIVLFVLGLGLPIAFACISIFVSGGFPELDELSWYHYLVFVLLGFVVAITQLVPGLSATAVLMMVGCFAKLLDSVSFSYWKENPMVLLVYACLAIGLLIGLVAVSKLLSGLLAKFHGNCIGKIPRQLLLLHRRALARLDRHHVLQFRHDGNIRGVRFPPNPNHRRPKPGDRVIHPRVDRGLYVS